MRKRFRPDETFTVGQAVEVRHGSHWRAARIDGPRDLDMFGTPFYPAVDTAPSSRTAGRGDHVRAYPGAVRAAR